MKTLITLLLLSGTGLAQEISGGVKLTATAPLSISGKTISLAQGGATTGQALAWNGTAWVPTTISSSGGVSSITGTANEITVTGTTTPTLSLPSALTFTGKTITGGSHVALTGLGIRSSGAAFDLTLASSEVLTAGRTLSFNLGDAARTITLSGSPSLSGITTTGSGTIATGTFTLTVGATGTAALLGTAQTFTAAQSLSSTSSWHLFNTADQTTNYEGLKCYWNSNVITLAMSKGGTGSNRAMKIGGTDLGSGSNCFIYFAASGNLGISTTTTPNNINLGDGIVLQGGGFVQMPTAGYLSWNSDTYIYRDAAASVQHGVDHATTATNQTIKAHDVTTGTGAKMTIAGGTGSTAGGAVELATSVTTGAPVARLSVSASGTVTLPVAVPLAMASGTNQRAGNATLVGGTVTVSNTTVTANTVVKYSRKTAGGTLGNYTYTLSAGSSFTLNSDSIIDTSTLSYVLIEVP